jgi:hypothetical protein
MSQVSIVDIVKNNPQIPTLFIADIDEAIPIANTLEILGDVVPNQTFNQAVYTVGNGNTITTNVQVTAAIAASDITKVGLASFDSNDFIVDANGFVTLTGTGTAQTITGTTGGALSPTLGNWNIFGASTLAGTEPVSTSGSISTLTINVQKSQAIASSDATKVGLANFNSANFSVDVDGFVSLAGTGGAAIQTITGNTGGPEVPLAGNFNILGTGSITVAGSANTQTVQLTGITNHAIQIGAGTATLTQLAATATTGQILQNNSLSDPSWSTATYPSTTTINQILYSSSDNVVNGLSTVNSATLVTTSAGVPVMSSTMTNGQMIIGSTGATPTTGTITSTGGSIAVTTGAGTLNLEVSTGGFAWTDVTTATQAMVVQNGYITNRSGGVVYTLPATTVLGDEIKVVGKLGITTITPNANQQILMGSGSGTIGVTGTIVGTNLGDCVTLRAITAGSSTVWRAESFVGNWTIN